MLYRFEQRHEKIFDHLAGSIEDLATAVKRLNDRLDHTMSRNAFRLWIERLRARNPGLDIPDPDIFPVEKPYTKTPTLGDE